MIARLHFRDGCPFPFVRWQAVARAGRVIMKLLALDTATDTLALGVAHGGLDHARNHPGGGAASSHLIPQALDLLAEAGLGLAELDAIAFGCGPGAFTGLRIAVSVAQGLAFGAGKPVLSIDSLCIVADDARAQLGGQTVAAGGLWWAAMDARMDEVYAAAYRHDGQAWRTEVPPALYDLSTLAAVWALNPPAVVAGSALDAFGERLPATGAACRVPVVQDRAAALLRLARQAWRTAEQTGHHLAPDQALPVYLRDKVALTTAERDAAKAAAAAAAAATASSTGSGAAA